MTNSVKMDIIYLVAGDENLDFADYVSNPTWALAEGCGKGQVKVKYYPCCSEPYPSAEWSFLLKKRDNSDKDEDIIEELKNE